MRWRRVAALVAAVALAGCGSTSVVVATPRSGPLGPCQGVEDATLPAPVVGVGIDDAGHTCWETPLSDPPIQTHFPSTAKVSGSLVLFSSDGDVDAVDVADGRRSWRWSPGRESVGVVAATGAVVVVGVSPTIYGNVSKAGSPTELVGLDERTGKVRWRRVVPGQQAVSFVDTGDGGVLVSARFLGPEEVIDDADGALRWRTTVTPTSSGPGNPGGTFVAGDVIIDDDAMAGQVVALSTRTGTTLWRTSRTSSPVDAVGGVILAQPQPFTTFATSAIDPATGRTLWTVQGIDPSSFSEVDGALVAADSHGVERVDPATGHVEWHVAIPAEGAIAAGGLVVVDDANTDQAVAFDPADGTVRWRSPLPGQPGDALHLVESGGADGLVVAAGSAVVGLDPTSGARAWTVHLPAGTGPDGFDDNFVPVSGGVVLAAVTPAVIFQGQ